MTVVTGPPATSGASRSVVQRGSQVVRRSAIPLIQLGSAGLTLGLWLIVNDKAPAEYQGVVVRVFSYSAVLALTVTAGIAYVLPNLFRAEDRDTWPGAGPWSTPIALAIAINRACALAGALLAPVAIWVPDLRVIAATLAASAVLSTAILTAQLARLQDSLWAMAVALSPNPFIPLVFLVLAGVGVPIGWAGFGFCIGALVLDELIFRRYRPMTANRRSLDRESARSVVGTAAAMVPHLLCFAAIMQGPRLIEALQGSDRQLLASHQVMLLVTIGTTVVTSFHGYISVGLQSTADADYHARLRAFGLQYAAIGALASIGVALLVVLVAPAVVSTFPDLTWSGRLAVIIALPTITTYFALSAQVVRSNRTALLALVSGSTLLIYAVVSLAAPVATPSEAFVRYAVCLLALPVILWGVVSVVDPGQRLPLGRLLATASLGFVPVVVLAGGLAVASLAGWS